MRQLARDLGARMPRERDLGEIWARDLGAMMRWKAEGAAAVAAAAAAAAVVAAVVAAAVAAAAAAAAAADASHVAGIRCHLCVMSTRASGRSTRGVRCEPGHNASASI